MCEVKKPLLLLEIPYCEQNEIQVPIININVLILICKCNHGDFNSYDVKNNTCYVYKLKSKR